MVVLCRDAGLNILLEHSAGTTRDKALQAAKSVDCVDLSLMHESWPNLIKEALLVWRRFVATDVSDIESITAFKQDSKIV